RGADRAGARARPRELDACKHAEPEAEQDEPAGSLTGDEHTAAARGGSDAVGVAAEAEVRLEPGAEVGLVEPRHRVAVLIGREDIPRGERERARVLPDRRLVRERPRVARIELEPPDGV